MKPNPTKVRFFLSSLSENKIPRAQPTAPWEMVNKAADESDRTSGLPCSLLIAEDSSFLSDISVLLQLISPTTKCQVTTLFGCPWANLEDIR
jgi:hypothetical protein